jgi:hypothetical protein
MTHTIDEGHAWVVAAREQVCCALQGEVVILNMQHGVYYGLDPVGAQIWPWLQAPIMGHTVRERLRHTSAVDPDRCAHDLLGLLRPLAEAGRIEVMDDPPASMPPARLESARSADQGRPVPGGQRVGGTVAPVGAPRCRAHGWVARQGRLVRGSGDVASSPFLSAWESTGA